MKKASSFTNRLMGFVGIMSCVCLVALYNIFMHISLWLAATFTLTSSIYLFIIYLALALGAIFWISKIEKDN